MQIVYNVTRHVVAVHLVLLLFIHPVTLQATENRPKHAQQREAEYQPLETELSETESGSSQEDRLRKEIKRKIKNIMNGKRSMVIFGALFCFVVASSAKLVNDLY